MVYIVNTQLVLCPVSGVNYMVTSANINSSKHQYGARGSSENNIIIHSSSSI